LSHNDIQRNGRKPHDLRPGVLIIGAARPVLVGNVFNENGSVAVAVPEGMDGAPILKFNFFLKGEPLGHAEPGGIGGTPAKRRRRP
jgi:hypothetical protein